MLKNNSKIIKHKVDLLNLAEQLGNVSKACKIMGLSRRTYYRYQSAFEQGGVDALFNKSRRQMNINNRTDPATERLILDHALAFPAHGQRRVSNELSKLGILISPSGVRSIWAKHGLSQLEDRLKAMKNKVAEQGLTLSDAQAAALEKQQQHHDIGLEVAAAYPGHVACQDTLYVGTFNGIGRVYQQTFIDMYSNLAFAKLYSSKTPISAADILHSKVLPFFKAEGLTVQRIMTDTDSEYCGDTQIHGYQMYLTNNHIQHIKVQIRLPQTQAIFEHFHKIILQEFYQKISSEQSQNTLITLQKKLDEWLEDYNNQPINYHKACNGRTAMATFREDKGLCNNN